MKDLARIILFFALILCPSWGNALLASCSDKEHIKVQLRGRIFPAEKIAGAVLFIAGMEVDIDGAPNAYGPDDRGLDFTQNAKNGNKFVGVITGADGKPVVQQSGVFKGFYVSQTSLFNSRGNRSDPATYVDATKIPYIALPPGFTARFGVVLGDLAVVTNRKNGKSSFAIFADGGPTNKIGEGSVALAAALGLKADPRHGGTEELIISYLVFPKSGLGKGKLRTLEEINSSASHLFRQWGGGEKLKACSSGN